MTLHNSVMKFTPFFDTKYLTNSLRHGHARECEWETVPKLSNGIVSNDLERPLTYM